MKHVHPIFAPILNAIAPAGTHTCVTEHLSEYEIQSVCSCGWKSRIEHRISNDYAWGSLREQTEEHLRKVAK